MRASSSKIILAVGIGAYFLVFGTLTALRHAHFQTQAWDMGIFEQTLWNTIHGRVMQNTIEEIPNHLGIHMSPFLFLLVPGFALFPSPYYLLVIQTLALSLGAIPAYLLALRILAIRRWALRLAGIYLRYPPLHWVNWFDFHEIAFFVPLALAGIYFLETERRVWAWIFLILAASTKEDAILTVAAIGIWFLFKPAPTPRGVLGVDNLKLSTVYAHRGLPSGFLGVKKWVAERKQGVILAITMLAYFFIATKLIMPALGGGLLRLDRYAQFGQTPAEIILTITHRPLLLIQTVFTPEKLAYLFWLLAPFAFLPFAAPRALILVLPGLLENLLTTFRSQFSSLYQYDAILIPGLFVAALYGLCAIRTRWPRYERGAMTAVVSAAILVFILHSPASPTSFPVRLFTADPLADTYRAMTRAIPKTASVAANTNLIPHIANRERVYTLGREPSPADIVLLDGGDYFGFPDPESFQRYADDYALSGLYAVQIISERYFVFTRKNFLP
ncbi:MAG: DUF2079 domain-containing protein [Candidatus Niyogibacteria bacterium]|nr:DUF2079 domain-containing protein [Candidatus Niyogibacteria bacterium]